MSNNRFSGRRFMLLCKQHLIHNSQLLLLSAMAYVGSIFIVLSIVQIANELVPHDVEIFQGVLVGFFVVFGILYVGHSFPGFRSKESAMTYLMLPASLLEKFVFEFISRLLVILILLPLLYWITFHLQGYLFTIFATRYFEPVSIQYLIRVHNVSELDNLFWEYLVAIESALLGFVVALTGAAAFAKQPLVKTLFSLAVIVIFYLGYSYRVVERLGVGNYNPPESMWLIPLSEAGALRFFSAALALAIMTMSYVAFRKLKEREV